LLRCKFLKRWRCTYMTHDRWIGCRSRMVSTHECRVILTNFSRFSKMQSDKLLSGKGRRSLQFFLLVQFFIRLACVYSQLSLFWKNWLHTVWPDWAIFRMSTLGNFRKNGRSSHNLWASFFMVKVMHRFSPQNRLGHILVYFSQTHPVTLTTYQSDEGNWDSFCSNSESESETQYSQLWRNILLNWSQSSEFTATTQ
jgi:hypothetical protein